MRIFEKTLYYFNITATNTYCPNISSNNDNNFTKGKYKYRFLDSEL